MKSFIIVYISLQIASYFTQHNLRHLKPSKLLFILCSEKCQILMIFIDRKLALIYFKFPSVQLINKPGHICGVGEKFDIYDHIVEECIV